MVLLGMNISPTRLILLPKTPKYICPTVAIQCGNITSNVLTTSPFNPILHYFALCVKKSIACCFTVGSIPVFPMNLCTKHLLRFYPTSDGQITLCSTLARRAGFGGGVVIDYPNSKKARKVFLCLFVGSGSQAVSSNFLLSHVCFPRLIFLIRLCRAGASWSGR